MRTTIRLDSHLLSRVKTAAAEKRTTMTAIIEDALREALERRTPQARQSLFRMRTFRGGGPRPGFDLDNTAEVLERMERGGSP